MPEKTLPITVLVATKNEARNIEKCLASLRPAQNVILLDSQSNDGTPELARSMGVEVLDYCYSGGYPKKRQWALDQVSFETPWVMLLDADEVVPNSLWEEISYAMEGTETPDAFLITKGFHFLGRRFRHGGFSHSAVLLFRQGKARFEQLDDSVRTEHDMEVHERLIVHGTVGRLKTPLIHEDFKGLTAYIDRHNQYSAWEAGVRYRYLQSGAYGEESIRPNLFGNVQQRRRFLKGIAVRLPFEPTLWFLYHYVFRLGFLEGRRGLIASQIRAAYISQARAKVYELRLGSQLPSDANHIPRRSPKPFSPVRHR